MHVDAERLANPGAQLLGHAVVLLGELAGAEDEVSGACLARGSDRKAAHGLPVDQAGPLGGAGSGQLPHHHDRGCQQRRSRDARHGGATAGAGGHEPDTSRPSAPARGNALLK